MSLLLGLEPFQKSAVGGGAGWWSKRILEFRFGPNLELRLEPGTKLNNNVWLQKVEFFLNESFCSIIKNVIPGLKCSNLH